jgi:hypothetical protein
MQDCYHPQATFSDEAFKDLSAEEVKAMWQMLITSGSDLKLKFSDVEVSGDRGTCHWEAWYTFSRSGRKVHNVIDADFEFKDGKIYRHRDHFNFWRWSRMAFGASGLLLGWTPFLQNKVQSGAKERLRSFMEKQDA